MLCYYGDTIVPNINNNNVILSASLNMSLTKIIQVNVEEY